MSSTDTTDWETVEVPHGTYVKWDAPKVVTGTVLAYSDTAGRTMAQEPCPEMTISTTDGDMATISASQIALARAMMAAGFNPGDLVRIEYTGDTKTNSGNTVKQFDVKVKRGGGTMPTPPVAVADETPF